MHKEPKIGIDILILKENKILLGKLTKKWSGNYECLYGVPGRDLQFKETIGDCVKRNVKGELGCELVSYEIFSVNANYEYDNHYIGIGVKVEISGEPKLMKDEDWEQWKWFEVSKLPKNIFAPAKNLIESYLTKQITVSE